MASGTITIKHTSNGYWMRRSIKDGTEKPRPERIKVEGVLTEAQVLDRVRPYVGADVQFDGDSASFEMLTRCLGDVVHWA